MELGTYLKMPSLLSTTMVALQQISTALQADVLAFAGESVAKYIREPSPFNTQIVSLGVDTYLKMLLADNFVHTDLHPGNIMVRIRGVCCLPTTSLLSASCCIK